MRESTLRRLERFNRALELLEWLRSRDKEELMRDIALQSIAKRNIQVAADFCVDLSAFLLSQLGESVPTRYKEIIEAVKRRGIVDRYLGDRVKGIVGLMNIIIHLYAEVKADIIYDNLGEIVSDLREFVKHLMDYCRREGIDP